jgi:RNase H-fold protein (predicted Holliday junction resolvase)
MDQYMKGVRPDTARKVKREQIQVDDSAAALILQRYLDKKNAI